MNELESIQNKIYEIRGQRVMLDRDLAAMYGVETRILNQAVRRNATRFDGDDFMFQLTKDEVMQVASRSQFMTSNIPDNKGLLEDSNSLRSQFVTSNNGRGGVRYLPYAFTELGVAMLSSVLRSETAISINRKIMRAFVSFHRIAAALPDAAADVAQLRKDFEELKLDIEDILADQNNINEDTRMQLELINQSLAALQAQPKKPHRPIGFK